MADVPPPTQSASVSTPTLLPRVAIQFCTQCGTFTVTLTHLPAGAETTSTTILWDRKTEGGFPETKELKRRLRDVIQPDRDLGHVDRKHAKPTPDTTKPSTQASLASDAIAEAPTMAPSSASDVVSQLKKHPANANKTPTGEDSPNTTTTTSAAEQEQSTLSEAARDAIGAARANTGQKTKTEISSAGILPRQHFDDLPADANKEKCEDCA
ncbi:selT/selW/selH selenoprotein domain-containing protein [Colletotrichum higginsianum]|nr:selT/selW/selH selenoprotein domain-containing protein [Colletotrichum higginsianum]